MHVDVTTVEGRERRIALRVTDLVKTFGGTRAVDGVSFDLEAGTIHALLGGNGSGKSTTIKVLSGMYKAEQGVIAFDDEYGAGASDASSWTAARAREAGLRFVHQQCSTFPELTVAENLAVGHGFETGVGGRVRWRAQRRHARDTLRRFGLDLDPTSPLARYGVATHAMVAIARALQDLAPTDDGGAAGVLVLDEPTAALPPREVTVLLDELKRLAGQGQTIVYVTHRLEEVVEIADRATILRDGRVAATLDGSEITHDALVELIAGESRVTTATVSHAPRPGGVARLRCAGLVGGAVRGADFDVRAGEIVGVAGLLGSGRSSLLRLVSGDAARDAGEVFLDDVPVSFGSPRDGVRAGVAYSPEDRRDSAAFMDLSVRENMGILSTRGYFRWGRLRHRCEARDAHDLCGTYQVRAASTEMPLGLLSGGNQQKALLARWLRLEPRLLLLDEPTQGIDVGARAEIWQLVRRAVDRGSAALVVLSDLEELVSMCDRVILVRRGETVGELDCKELTDTALEQAVLATEGTNVA
ncbi:sugar ABC transporter ATP-binding protein [Nocardioides speluncae]|uniref:sugar ABC transporter ATP-binding protein n=1 Tax=Nocardioides speluncae TaxID=2670337 RepID=UPI000D69DDCF|nr:sugar ABC transporter ATP-binding protein [Nocardioides speluncae]